MYILQIEYPAPNFDIWREAFNRSTIEGKNSGLRGYQIFRPVDNSNYVIVELEFNEANQAEDFIGQLHRIWREDENKLLLNPQARIFEVVESGDI